LSPFGRVLFPALRFPQNPRLAAGFVLSGVLTACGRTTIAGPLSAATTRHNDEEKPP